jgi:very-short-patch-repair endonuclease
LREAELQQPKSNVNIVGWEVDFIWPQQRLVVEVDGYPFHSSRAAFERDRRKDMALRDSGYDVIRISARQLKERPYAVIAHIARALERGRRSSG